MTFLLWPPGARAKQTQPNNLQSSGLRSKVGKILDTTSSAETPYPKKVLQLPEILTQAEVARLIDATETLFQRILVMTLYATGAR